jgi:Dolichyl-phosphate-mannose-protein mannosyltransferase
MDTILLALCFIYGVVMMIFAFPEGISATLVTIIISLATLFFISIYSDDQKEKQFLRQVFIIALLARLSLGLLIHLGDMRGFFGGDANTYNYLGSLISDIWAGTAARDADYSERALSTHGPGWGMNYIIGAVYFLFGKNILAGQCFCASIGAATSPITYACSQSVFSNKQVSRISALMVALYPAMIMWSGQMLKDGLIIFLLVLSITLVLTLQKRLNYLHVVVLVIALFGILALRFYIFYMVVLAIVGSFILGSDLSIVSIIRRTFAVIGVGLALTLIGGLQTAQKDYEDYMTLERVNISRKDLASAGSGFSEEVDVSTPAGAIAAIPVGFVYLMLAPFPWQISSVRSAITLPEVILWWSLMPFLVAGLWYTLKYRFRSSIAILLFTVMLTIAYSIFQGNVGTAYRQRTQIQVFLFIFIAVGWTLRKENEENRKLRKRLRIQQLSIKS